MSSASSQNTRHTLTITSSAFSDGGDIPAVYTCDGDGINPPLSIEGVGDTAQSLALIMDDPDAPIGVFDHWVVFNIPPETTAIEEGVEPDGILGVGTSGELGYLGPCPPGERHRYIFHLYALDTLLDLNEGASKSDLREAMKEHVLQEGSLMGHYER